MDENAKTPEPKEVIVTKTSSTKPFLIGCVVGGCLSPILIIALLSAIVTVAGPAVGTVETSQLKNPGLTSYIQSSLGVSQKVTPLPLTPVTAKDCGTNQTCIFDAAKNCTPAKAEVVSGGMTLAYQVIGKGTNNPSLCKVSFEIQNVTDSTLKTLGLENQNMVCELNPTLLQNGANILKAPDTELNCEGSLWGLLKIVRAGEQNSTSK